MACAAWMLGAGVACAQGTDPLALVPQVQGDALAAESVGLRVELARDWFVRRDKHSAAHAHQIAFDFRHEWGIDPGWKLGLSDRAEQSSAPDGDQTRNALREAYVSRALGPAGYLDAGRINWRNGVATGSNPSDFLKRGALVAQTTQNPQSLRENRLGTVMLRGQVLSARGSAQLALIPDLAHAVSTGAAAPAWDRTNGARAVLLKLTPRVVERTSVDVLAYGRAGERPRWGANLTQLVGDAWVAYAEWAGGVLRPLAGPDEAQRAAGWTNAVAAGLSWTTPSGLVLTLERQYAGDALTPERWRAWRDALATPQAALLGPQLGALRAARAADQAPLTRDAWFARAAWDDAFDVRDIDLAAFARLNASDHSSMWQAEARWHVSDRHSLAVLIGGDAGDALSEYGSMALRRYAQLNWSMYF